jgi:hypothetical protein
VLYISRPIGENTIFQKPAEEIFGQNLQQSRTLANFKHIIVPFWNSICDYRVTFGGSGTTVPGARFPRENPKKAKKSYFL